MNMRSLLEPFEMFWTLESHEQQRMAWRDAAEARIARSRADELAARQLQAMLDANPTGSLGHAVLNDGETLQRSGLIK